MIVTNLFGLVLLLFALPLKMHTLASLLHLSSLIEPTSSRIKIFLLQNHFWFGDSSIKIWLLMTWLDLEVAHWSPYVAPVNVLLKPQFTLYLNVLMVLSFGIGLENLSSLFSLALPSTTSSPNATKACHLKVP